MQRGLRTSFLLLTLAGALTATGCGPISYIVAVNDAAEAVEEARTSGAADTSIGPATYNYWLAVEHLNKARELAGDAEYQAASEMADSATEAGHRARALEQQQHEAAR